MKSAQFNLAPQQGKTNLTELNYKPAEDSASTARIPKASEFTMSALAKAYGLKNSQPAGYQIKGSAEKRNLDSLFSVIANVTSFISKHDAKFQSMIAEFDNNLDSVKEFISENELVPDKKQETLLIPTELAKGKSTYKIGSAEEVLGCLPEHEIDESEFNTMFDEVKNKINSMPGGNLFSMGLNADQIAMIKLFDFDGRNILAKIGRTGMNYNRYYMDLNLMDVESSPFMRIYFDENRKFDNVMMAPVRTELETEKSDYQLYIHPDINTLRIIKAHVW